MDLEGRKLLIYGAGKAGQLICQILEICCVPVWGFLDNDIQKDGKCIINNVKCTQPNSLYNKDDYIVCIAISNEKYVPVSDDEIRKGARYNVIHRDLIDACSFKHYLIQNESKNQLMAQARMDGFEHFLDFATIIDEFVLRNEETLKKVLVSAYSAAYVDIFLPDKGMNNGNYSFGKPENPVSIDERIAVYTGVFGGYDDVHIPSSYPENIDYYYVSDDKPEGLGLVRWIDAKTIIPENVIGSVKRNRYIKMHPHIIFPDYRFTIYIDGALQVVDDVSSFINPSPTGISAFEHYERDCLFYEALQIVNGKRVVPDDVYKHLLRYIYEGMPIHFGLAEMAVVACDHSNENCDRILENWWEEFNRGAQRDQLSFTYILWKHGFEISDICSLGENFRNCPRLIYHLHPKLSEDIRNV